VTRRPWLALTALVVVAALVTGWIFLARERGETTVAQAPGQGAGLTLLVVQAKAESFGAVIGSTDGTDGALVLPGEIQVTIPGQGDATMREALELPPRQAATTVANVLGVWVEHYAIIGPERFREVVDRAGGIAVGQERQTGAEVLATLDGAGEGRTAAFALALGGLLSPEVSWEPTDLVDSDSEASVIEILEAARGVSVTAIPVVEAATGIFQAEPEAVRESIVDAFGGPDREVVRVIVLNGSGVPGVGELVAERIVPGGFRIVVSENASSFDHDETLVVVGSADDVALGERVRDLLGTGSVNISVPSGIAPVTVLVGKDFSA
jgi:LytR cell envelope-related transcriptional attenuator